LMHAADDEVGQRDALQVRSLPEQGLLPRRGGGRADGLDRKLDSKTQNRVGQGL
jgi:hypothetical protein